MARKTTAGISGLTTNEIHRELKRRAGLVRGLMARRNKLLEKVAKLDSEIRSNGGVVGVVAMGKGADLTARGTPRIRAVNKTGLAEALHNTLKNKTMGVTEVSKAVVEDGYKTTAENFRTIVNQCLIKHRRMFKKVSRGQYTSI